MADYSKIKTKDMINPLKWGSVIQGWVNKTFFIKPHLIEQYFFRMNMCPKCIEKGSCIDCGCTIPDKMLVPLESCSMGNWGPIKSSKEWFNYKNKLGIEFKIIINKKEWEQ